MADIEQTIVLDDAQYERGIRKVINRGEEAGKKLDKSFNQANKATSTFSEEAGEGFNGLEVVMRGVAEVAEIVGAAVGGVAAIIASQVQAIADSSDNAERSINSITAALGRMRDNIIADVFGGIGSFLGQWLDDLEEWRQGVVSALADPTGIIGNAQALFRAVEKQQRQQTNFDKLFERVGAQLASVNEEPVEAARLSGRSQRRAFAKEVNEMLRNEDLTSIQATDLISMMQELADARVQRARERQEERERRAEQSDRLRNTVSAPTGTPSGVRAQIFGGMAVRTMPGLRQTEDNTKKTAENTGEILKTLRDTFGSRFGR